MVKHPLFIICLIIFITILYAVMIVISILMILRGILWDFKFQLKVNEEIYTFKDLWVGASDHPIEIWTELKSAFKL